MEGSSSHALKHGLPMMASNTSFKRQKLSSTSAAIVPHNYGGNAAPRGKPPSRSNNTEGSLNNNPRISQHPSGPASRHPNLQNPQSSAASLLPSRNLRLQAAQTAQAAKQSMGKSHAPVQSPGVKVMGEIIKPKIKPLESKLTTPRSSINGGVGRKPNSRSSAPLGYTSHPPAQLDFSPSTLQKTSRQIAPQEASAIPPLHTVESVHQSTEAMPLPPAVNRIHPTGPARPSSTSLPPSRGGNHVDPPLPRISSTRTRTASVTTSNNRNHSTNLPTANQPTSKPLTVQQPALAPPSALSSDVEFDAGLWEIMDAYEGNLKPNKQELPAISPTPLSLLSPPVPEDLNEANPHGLWEDHASPLVIKEKQTARGAHDLQDDLGERNCVSTVKAITELDLMTSSTKATGHLSTEETTTTKKEDTSAERGRELGQECVPTEDTTPIQENGGNPFHEAEGRSHSGPVNEKSSDPNKVDEEYQTWMLLTAHHQGLTRFMNPAYHASRALQRLLQQAHSDLLALLSPALRMEPETAEPSLLSTMVFPKPAAPMPQDLHSMGATLPSSSLPSLRPDVLRSLSDSLLRALSELGYSTNGLAVLKALQNVMTELQLPEGWLSSERRVVAGAVLRMLHPLLLYDNRCCKALLHLPWDSTPSDTTTANLPPAFRSSRILLPRDKEKDEMIVTKSDHKEGAKESVDSIAFPPDAMLPWLMEGLRRDCVFKDPHLPSHILSILTILLPQCPGHALSRFAPLLGNDTLKILLRKETGISVKEKVLDILHSLLMISGTTPGNLLERVVNLLSVTDHGTAKEMRPLRRKVVRLLSCLILPKNDSSYQAKGNPFTNHMDAEDNKGGTGLFSISTKLVSCLVLLIDGELRSLDAGEDEMASLASMLKEAVHLLWVYTHHHLRNALDIRQHFHPVRHLLIAVTSRFMNRQVPRALWDLADIAIYLRASLLDL